jgi:hypothetical protein
LISHDPARDRAIALARIASPERIQDRRKSKGPANAAEEIAEKMDLARRSQRPQREIAGRFCMNVDGHENGKTLVRLCALSALCAIRFLRPLRDDLIHPLISRKEIAETMDLARRSQRPQREIAGRFCVNVDGDENGKNLVHLCALCALCAVPFSWRPLRDDLIHPLISRK